MVWRARGEFSGFPKEPQDPPGRRRPPRKRGNQRRNHNEHAREFLGFRDVAFFTGFTKFLCTWLFCLIVTHGARLSRRALSARSSNKDSEIIRLMMDSSETMRAKRPIMAFSGMPRKKTLTLGADLLMSARTSSASNTDATTGNAIRSATVNEAPKSSAMSVAAWVVVAASGNTC